MFVTYWGSSGRLGWVRRVAQEVGGLLASQTDLLQVGSSRSIVEFCRYGGDPGSKPKMLEG